ncbi:MAG: hypothetical protein ACUVWR_15200 [Anaerolineae bacterium]
MAAMVSSAALYALLDTSDGAHQATAAALQQGEGPLVLVAPVLSDVMRLAERFLGREAALRLLDAVLAGELLLQPLERRDLQAARQLLRQDARLGASAALALAATERLGVPIMLCLEPAVREMASQQGLAVLPHSEAEGA